MLEPPQREDTGLESQFDPEAMVNWSYLQGKTGQAVTHLAPAGKARLDGQFLDVISDGRFIEKGTRVRVVEVAGNRILVTQDQA